MSQGTGDSSVAWDSAPCTEPVLMIPVDRENVRDHIPKSFPGSEDEFMDNLVTDPGGTLATVVVTLNRCESGEIIRTVNDNEQEKSLANDTVEVLVTVMYEGEADAEFQVYTLGSYVNERKRAEAFRWLGLPSRARAEYHLRA